MTLDLHANFEDVVCPDCYTPHIWIINLNQQEIHWNLPRKLTLLKFNQLKTDIHTKLQKSRRKLYWARAKMFPRQRFLYMIQWCADECLTASSLRCGSKTLVYDICLFSNFHGWNIPTTTYFRLLTRCYWMWNWEKMHSSIQLCVT